MATIPRIDIAATLAALPAFPQLRGKRLPATVAPMPFQPTSYNR